MIAPRRAVVALGVLALLAPLLQAQPALPRLADAPVNDLATVIDPPHAAGMDAMIRELKEKTGDTVMVVTVPTIAGWGDIREYAVKLFEQHGIGGRGQDNGLLVLLALDERRVWIEVGYGLEPYITDGFAGETIRGVMLPAFRQGDYGGGLERGVARLIGRLAAARQVEITGAPPPAAQVRHAPGLPPGAGLALLVFVFVVVQWLSMLSRLRRRRRRGWGRRRTWSGWHSGVGPFGGGLGGGWGGGGGFGGGFGGFGGGRSGGGGAGGSW